ncbi:hypothetical protein [Ottowia beijingensis]|uniref:hypothetical protein n=1 Tax=Ottowia beijingensis TaxID=1207057 RepID=UPI003624CB13
MNKANVIKALSDKAAEHATWASLRDDEAESRTDVVEKRNQHDIAEEHRQQQGELLATVNHLNGVSPE